ncbi:MAG TPA: DNA translocase FtsK [Caldilineaceae bacterium]|nr:DNA translocase FtsK [Caldilineaceae bacterium]
MAKSDMQMNRLPTGSANPDWDLDWRGQFSVHVIGFALVGLGAFLFLSLRAERTLPWLVQMTGWTAPLVALALFVMGAILVLGDRAGYWSAEALVGAELLLVGLMAGTFAWHNDAFTWNMRLDGSNGGLVGWVLGGLLVAGFGQGLAAILTFLLCVAGAGMLLYYTPLVYPASFVLRLFSAVLLDGMQWAADQRARRAHSRAAAPGARLIVTPNFVSPTPPPEPPAPARPATRAPAAPRAQNLASQAKPAAKKATRGRSAKPAPRPADLPPFDLLRPDSGKSGAVDVAALQEAIEGTLEDFGVPVRVVHVESGPTVTQFGVEPLYVERSGRRQKVRVNRIVNLADDLALALAAPAVRIEAPVPGRPYVGIEVPNTIKSEVSLRGILESETIRSQKGELLLALGRDTAGAPVVMDLVRAPHLLIAGATGAGKSVCINTIITSLLMQHGPESLRFVMVDPKMVELPGYNGIPHLIGKVITDVQQVMGALTWLLLQMDDRYRLFREHGVRNLEAYNALARSRKRGANALAPLPHIVLIVDELADLMMTAAEDIERQICRLAQMARATGIHLILATQRPSTDVVTGLIKANFPSRIAFAVTSQIDSRVILDTPGAERLLGRGDMLLMRPDAAKLFRLQGCFVSDDEIARVVSFWKAQADPAAQAAPPPWNGLLDQAEQQDELVLEAIDVLRGMKTCSASMLQRKLKIGYPKAARLMEQLEAQGIVGPDMGGGQGREVLLNDEEMEEYDEELEPA